LLDVVRSVESHTGPDVQSPLYTHVEVVTQSLRVNPGLMRVAEDDVGSAFLDHLPGLVRLTLGGDRPLVAVGVGDAGKELGGRTRRIVVDPAEVRKAHEVWKFQSTKVPKAGETRAQRDGETVGVIGPTHSLLCLRSGLVDHLSYLVPLIQLILERGLELLRHAKIGR